MMHFETAPSVWGSYPKILLARKPRWVPDGASVPRLDAHLHRVRMDRAHLARYRELTGDAPGETLPPAYPHVLAMPLHMALLSSESFPVQLLGLVHIHNRIEQQRPVRLDEEAALHASIEGHRDEERGQEFDLHTELVTADGQRIWQETCTFLARRRGKSRGEAAAARAGQGDAASVHTSSFRADAGIGRRYGWISGDVNPIHLFDLTARAFGFDGAIAHGMWSLARCAAELGPGAFAGPCVLEAQFKLPIFLPAWVTMHSWPLREGTGFVLRDAQGDKPHLSGTLIRTR